MGTIHAIPAGIRVVRGPDWNYNNQDGGEGFVGTTIYLTGQDSHPDDRSGVVNVLWDSGTTGKYRIGLDGKYDLRLYDSAQKGVEHTSVNCAACQEIGVKGTRWTCVECLNYDLCTPCYMSNQHFVDHAFYRIDHQYAMRVQVPRRTNSTDIRAKGIFLGAEVVPGLHWEGNYSNASDGGLVKSIEPHDFIQNQKYHIRTARSKAMVLWKPSGKTSSCRIGLHGKVDLKFRTPTFGWNYYPDHLAILGVHLSKEVGERILTDYSKVQCVSHPVVLNMLQAGHGAWYEQTKYLLGRKGTVVAQNQTGNVWVEFSGLTKTYSINPAALTPIFDEDDIVLVINREERIRRLQYGHGGWQDGISEILGQTVEVQSTDKNGDVQVRFGKRSWTFNPDCLIHLTALPQWEELAKQQEAHKFRRNQSFMTMVDQNALLKVKRKETTLQIGDMVHICDDLETVRSVQAKNGIWTESMKMIVGKVGAVQRLMPNDSLSVQVGETVWKLKKELCLQLSESAALQRNAASNLLQFY